MGQNQIVFFKKKSWIHHWITKHLSEVHIEQQMDDRVLTKWRYLFTLHCGSVATKTFGLHF